MWYNSDMQNLICVVLFGVVATSVLFTKDPAKKPMKDSVKVEDSMVVRRCQAELEDGSQCTHQAEKGKKFCWRHSEVATAVNKTMKATADGSQKAWQSTKTWSTNAWESTKFGWNKAVDATKESFDGARVGMVELLGGKDAKKDAK